MNSTFLLLEDIRKHLKKAFWGVKFREPVNNGNALTEDGQEKYREPRFYIESLPPKRQGTTPDGEDQGEDVPYVLIKPLTGEGQGESPRKYVVRVGIVFAVYDAEGNPEAGAHDMMNMHDRILTSMLRRELWSDSHYAKVLPITSRFGIGKPADVHDSRWQTGGPYHGGAIFTEFHAAVAPFASAHDTIDACESGCEHI